MGGAALLYAYPERAQGGPHRRRALRPLTHGAAPGQRQGLHQISGPPLGQRHGRSPTLACSVHHVLRRERGHDRRPGRLPRNGAPLGHPERRQLSGGSFVDERPRRTIESGHRQPDIGDGDARDPGSQGGGGPR